MIVSETSGNQGLPLCWKFVPLSSPSLVSSHFGNFHSSFLCIVIFGRSPVHRSLVLCCWSPQILLHHMYLGNFSFFDLLSTSRISPAQDPVSQKFTLRDSLRPAGNRSRQICELSLTFRQFVPSSDQRRFLHRRILLKGIRYATVYRCDILIFIFILK